MHMRMQVSTGSRIMAIQKAIMRANILRILLASTRTLKCTRSCIFFEMLRLHCYPLTTDPLVMVAWTPRRIMSCRFPLYRAFKLKSLLMDNDSSTFALQY